MKFRRWFDFTENIIVNDAGGGVAALQIVSPGLIKDFNYQGDETYSSFFVAAYQARRQGYVHIGTHPTHVGITKTTPIEQGKGTDISFIKGLMSQLSAARLKPVPYKEGESGWADVVRQFGQEDLQKDFRQAAEKDVQPPQVPDLKAGASNMQKITPGMSVSRASGSWSYFVQSSSAEYLIPRILEIMEKAVKPLVDNDVVDWYEIVDRMSGRRQKVVYSPRGERGKNDEETKYRNGVSYMKFLAENMLKNHPNAKNLVLSHVNQVGIKVVGGGENPVQKIQAANTRVPLNDLIGLVRNSYADDNVLLFFINALKTDDDYLYKIMDKVAQEQNPRYSLHQVDMLLNKKTDYLFDNVGIHLHDALELFKQHKILQELVPNEFNEFKSQYQDAVNQFVAEGDVDAREIKYLKQLADYIDVEAIDQVNKLHGEIQGREAEERRKRSESQERMKFVVQEGSSKYVVLGDGDTVWKDIPDKYVDYRGDLEEGEFCLGEIVDSEEVFHAAHEKASEEAWGNAEARPSESYGEDKDEVEGDMAYYGDDFVNDENIEVPEGLSDDDFVNLIKNNYYDEFLRWRIEKLKEEEEEDGWKYEPEPDEQDVWRHQEELAVELAFDEKGLAVLLGMENNDLKVEFNSKFKSQLMPILKKTLEISTREKDREFGEPLLKIGNKVRLSYRDKDRDDVVSVYDLLRSV